MDNIQKFWKHFSERQNTSIIWQDIKQEEIQKQPFMTISIYVRKFTEIDFMYDLIYEKFELMEFIEKQHGIIYNFSSVLTWVRIPFATGLDLIFSRYRLWIGSKSQFLQFSN